ncbi:MAG TPA: type II toxin-antitoxin system VapC family toxin [Vicinamibacterales bacterium]|nr:type II toxin-antitoxin system VapC family toxin [Vicinamibacterales bacterium]HPW19461.1 type II toxin-antitoxin system VapC family toxin [Vicinamibacterales bacterium]
MRRVVVDTSALAGVVFHEAGGADSASRLEGAAVYAPTLLRYELQQVAAKKCREQPEQAAEVLQALERTLDLRSGIVWLDPHPTDVVLVANATGLSAYDASYLCLAGMLEAELVTQDQRLSAALDPFSGT